MLLSDSAARGEYDRGHDQQGRAHGAPRSSAATGAPAGVLAECHERVHDVVSRRDAAEHGGHIARLLGGGRQERAHVTSIADPWVY